MTADPDTSPPEGTDVARAIPDLASDLLRHSSTLVHKEVQLARAEISEALSQIAKALDGVILGAVLIGVSPGILLSAAVSGLARRLAGLFEGEAADAVAAGGLDGPGAAIVAAVRAGADDGARTLMT